MKVFIGWSGGTGLKISSILQNWLTRMFDNRINVVSSPSSLGTGDLWRRWMEAMSAADYALLCVTKNNVNSPWLAYEAGAFLGKSQTLIPLLFGVDASRLSAPLNTFQPVLFGFDGMRELTRKFNDMLGADALPAEELEQRFQARFPTLEMLLQDTLSESQPQTPDEEKRDELNALSAQFADLNARFADLSKRVEELETELSAAAKAPRKDSRVFGEAGGAQ